MVSTDDVQGYATKFANQLSKVDTADIDERDREAIHEFVRAVDARGDVNRGTMTSNLNRLRLSAERSDVPLVEMDKKDVDALIFSLKHDRGLSDGTLRNYRKALRKFYRERGANWYDDIKIGSSPQRSVDPDELLTDEEIDALLEACSNPRDKAMVALLADTGLRIGAIASLRIRDLDLTGQAGYVSINEDANVKGASGTIPITWSEGYVSGYLNVHPRQGDPEAALIHKSRGWYEDEDGDGAMTYQYLSSRVKKLADEADIDRSRVNTHNFRKSAISRWIREGMSEQAIKHRACWDVDTDQIKVYSGVKDEELNAQILDHYGIEDANEEVSRPTLDRCPRCSAALQPGHRFCPGCAAPLTQSAADATEDIEDDVFDSYGEALPDDRDAFAEFRERFNSDAEFRERLASTMAHSDSSS
jgi:integrase